MSFSRVKRQEIIRALLKEIESSTNNPVGTISQRFGISRQTTHNYLSDLIANGHVSVEGNKRNSKYTLRTVQHRKVYPLEGLQEDVVWSKDIKPLLIGIPDNVMRVCNYGFTEMLNNAIDHSESKNVYVWARLNILTIGFSICDEGVGIFHKIQKALSLEDPKYAILELAKGKFTTAPDKHTGEGIFFASRMFDYFYIFSQELTFSSGRSKTDYLWEDVKRPMKGTVVSMSIDRESDVSVKEVFDRFSSDDDSYGFSKTHVPVRLLDIDDGTLVSRSQAKRLMQRVDRFKEILLDFEGITEIGQGFADEIFRVFANEHPNIHLIPVNMTDDIRKMVYRATAHNLS